jgi:hypothetical protein
MHAPPLPLLELLLEPLLELLLELVVAFPPWSSQPCVLGHVDSSPQTPVSGAHMHSRTRVPSLQRHENGEQFAHGVSHFVGPSSGPPLPLVELEPAPAPDADVHAAASSVTSARDAIPRAAAFSRRQADFETFSSR